MKKNRRTLGGSLLTLIAAVILSASYPDQALAVGTQPVVLASNVNITRYLITGKRGDDVSKLQQFLIDNSNLKISQPTGYYGPLTTKAVAEWQETQGITPTGTVGPITRTRLSSGGGSGSSAASSSSDGSPITVIVPPGFVDALAQVIGQATTSTSTTAVASPTSSSGGGSSVSSGSSASSGSSQSRRRSSSRRVDYPSISSTDPLNGTTNAPRNRGIKIVFGEAMDASTISAGSITVTADDVAVSGTVTYSSIASAAAFTPSSNFGANADVMVTVSKNVRNALGVNLIDDFIFQFNAASGVADQTTIDLGTAASYGILAVGLANTNPTTVTGDIGTGLGGQSAAPSVISGTNHSNDSSYSSANLALNNALLDADTRVCDTTETGSLDLGSRTFTPGVHCFTGPSTLTGTTTLSTDGAFIFKFSDTITFATSSNISVVNGAHPSKAYWVANGTSVIKSSSKVLGNILANATTTLDSNAIVDGRLLSKSTIMTTGTTTASVPGTIYCSVVKPYFATNKAPAPNRTFTVAYIATSTVSITGEINAQPCDVGIYVAPGSNVTIANANIHDSYKVGVFNENGNVNISTSTIANIGDHLSVTSPWNFGGTQTGIGIEYLSTSTGSIINNTFTNYQKIGIVARGIDNIFIRNNIITGQGSTTMNAQTGLQVGFGVPSKVLTTLNVGNITGNTITGNIYTPTESAFGILASMMTGQSDVTLANTLLSTNTVTGNGLIADEDVIVGEY